MRAVCLMLCLLCVALTGCAVTGEVENQAYALVLGVDEAPGGGIALTIRIPRIGQDDGEGAQAESRGEPYLVISAAGENYPQALENLQWAVARELNLSQLKLLIVSEALASNARFAGLIAEIAATRHLYTTAAFIVCEGRAGDFIEGQETLLGSHLSSEIDAMFRHYAAHGFIPASTFADLYYATRSCYSDPTGIWGFPDAGEKPAAAVLEGDEDHLNAGTKTASSRQYLGAALFRKGVLAGKLDAGETLSLNLLAGRVTSFSYESGGRTFALSTALPTGLRVDIAGEKPQIRARVSLTTADPGDVIALGSDIARSIRETIKKCQRLGVEPFGFADRAAGRFATIQAWIAYDWPSRFRDAEIDVSVRVSGPA